MPKSAASDFRRILAPMRAGRPSSPFTEAVSAYEQERRKGLRVVLTASVFAVVFTVSSIFIGGQMLDFEKPVQVRQTLPALAETESNFERLLSENMQLKEELRQREAMIEELNARTLRLSTENVAEDGKTPASTESEGESSPAALENIPTIKEGQSGTAWIGEATATRSLA